MKTIMTKNKTSLNGKGMDSSFDFRFILSVTFRDFKIQTLFKINFLPNNKKRPFPTKIVTSI